MIVDKYLVSMAEHSRRAVQVVHLSDFTEDEKAIEIERLRRGVAAILGEVLAGAPEEVFLAFLERVRMQWLDASASVHTRRLMNQLIDPEENKKHVNR